MDRNWTFNEIDLRISEELQSFLPDKIFDIHNHIYRVSDLHPSGASLWTEGPQEVSIQVWKEDLGKFMGTSRLVGGLFFPVPMLSADLDRGNDYLIEQLHKHPDSRGLLMTTPDHRREDMNKYIIHPQISGFKIYHIYSKEKPTMQSTITGFCPDWMWEVANEHKLAVMLHIVRDQAVADPDNLREIRNLCEKNPEMQLILAHAGRCFHAPNAEKGIKVLRGLENVWFDCSAICEPDAIKIILKEFGPRRLMWGSDYPVSQMRGRSVTIGDGFTWINSEYFNWDMAPFLGKPVLAGIESLRALKLAVEDVGLNKEDIKDIFFNNASRLLGLEEEPLFQTQKLYEHAKKHIPGSVQLLSKRPENMAPDRWPAYYREARGCEVWDLDGRHYYDMSTNAVGACLLGYRDPDVTQAVIRRVQLGSMCSLNAPEEVELSNLLCSIHPWATQTRFAKGGGEACAIAVRIARATTDRSIVAICGYHGWQDWYLAANLGEDDSLRGHLLSGLKPWGVPRELRGTALTFTYNDRNALQSIIEQYGDRLAAVIMEPCRNDYPAPGFLEFVRECTKHVGALLIFDEVSIGWRLYHGGAHLKLGITPDIAVFAKAMGNGHPVAAIIGTDEAMQGAHESFISSTYWTEGVGPAAAIATIHKLEKHQVAAFVDRAGKRILHSWRRHSDSYHIPIDLEDAIPCLAQFRFHHESSEKLRTLYTQKMLDRGFLAGTAIYPTYAHNDAIIDRYDHAIEEVFSEIRNILEHGNIDKSLNGKVAFSGFKRLV